MGYKGSYYNIPKTIFYLLKGGYIRLHNVLQGFVGVYRVISRFYRGL